MKQKTFWNSLAFSMMQQILAIWSLVPFSLWNPVSRDTRTCIMYSWSLSWRILNLMLKDLGYYLTSMWNEHNCVLVWTFFDIALIWDWNENWPFPVLSPLLSFPTLLTYWVQHFNSIIFYDVKYLIWNSITFVSLVHSNASYYPLEFTLQVTWL